MVAVLVAGAFPVDAILRRLANVDTGGRFAVTPALALAALLALAAAGLARGVRRRWLATVLGAVGVPVTVFCAMFVMVRLAGDLPPGAGAASWWVSRLLQHDGWTYFPLVSAGGHPVEAVLPVLAGTLLITATTGFAYAVRVIRPLRLPLPTATVSPAKTAQAAPATAPAEATGLGRWWHRTALGGGLFSVLAWAFTLAYLTPRVGDPVPWPQENPGLVGG